MGRAEGGLAAEGGVGREQVALAGDFIERAGPHAGGEGRAGVDVRLREHPLLQVRALSALARHAVQIRDWQPSCGGLWPVTTLLASASGTTWTPCGPVAEREEQGGRSGQAGKQVVSSSRTPNKSRFIEAATIYRDSMAPFIESILEDAHGAGWVSSQLLNDEARVRNPRKYEKGMRSFQEGASSGNLIDHADIPFLVRNNLPHFPGLDHADVERMQSIRKLWSDKIKHRDELGDLEPEDAAEYAALCARILRHCGLSEAADVVAGLSTSAPAQAADTPERREWDKRRLSQKPAAALTSWEQQRLADIEWAEEQERLELLRRESEEIARTKQDVDGLRSWFDADPGRETRHPPEFADLQRAEQERARLASERAERELLAEELGEFARLGSDIAARLDWFGANPGREQRHPSEFADLQREQQILAEEQVELARLGSDVAARQRWFDADPDREQRHLSAFDGLQREQKILAEERAKLDQLGSDIDALRGWFDIDAGRQQRHPTQFAGLQRAERERERLASERAERELGAEERGELNRFGSDIAARRGWFDADSGREQRHPSAFATLKQDEQEQPRKERDELAKLSSDIDAQQDWFNADPDRKQRHQSAFFFLQRELGRLAKERAELDGLSPNANARRRWFGTDVGRKNRHWSEFIQLERDELALYSSDINARRRWFDADLGREQRHPSEFADLRSVEQERQEKEREDLARLGSDIDAKRNWFDEDVGRKQRHPSEFEDLE